MNQWPPLPPITPGTYLGWGDATIQSGNLPVIVVMPILFGLALVLLFPAGRPGNRPARIPGARPAQTRNRRPHVDGLVFVVASVVVLSLKGPQYRRVSSPGMLHQKRAPVDRGTALHAHGGPPLQQVLDDGKARRTGADLAHGDGCLPGFDAHGIHRVPAAKQYWLRADRFPGQRRLERHCCRGMVQHCRPGAGLHMAIMHLHLAEGPTRTPRCGCRCQHRPIRRRNCHEQGTRHHLGRCRAALAGARGRLQLPGRSRGDTGAMGDGGAVGLYCRRHVLAGSHQ